MLQVNEISVYYGNRPAVDRVSFSVAAGEIVTLIGSNGAGKSTTLKAVSGVLRARRGKILLDGERIDHLAPYKRLERGLVLVPEGRLLFPDMTVYEHLELGAIRARPGRSFADSVEWVYALFPRLQERRAQRAGTLSGGEQQMVAIARGLMANPRLLMLDEPSLGLAPVIVEGVAKVIRDLHRSGMTVVLVEQHVDLALSLAGRGYVLETGRVVMQDTAQALLVNPEIKKAYLGA
jgi:branched-chain amino acid transport system ATP-binding protein